MWRTPGLGNVRKENMEMALLDSLVSRCFRDDKAGRIVVFPGERRKRGYLVKSMAEELKIRSFLKMFFSAHLAILILGYLLAYDWARWLVYDLGRPADHFYRALCIFAGIYGLVLGLPYGLLWRTYKKARLSFVSVEDEVLVLAKPPPRSVRLIAAGIALVGIAVALGVVWLTRFK
jgi:hypothetical protein